VLRRQVACQENCIPGAQSWMRMRHVRVCMCVYGCVWVRAEGIVDILLDGGASVGVRNRKNQLPRQLTHNMKILNKLSAAVQQPTTQTHSSTAACTTRTNDVSLSLCISVCPLLYLVSKQCFDIVDWVAGRASSL